MRILFSLAALSLIAPVAHAADADADMPKPNIVYRKKTTVSFDDAVVEGSSDNPEGFTW